MMANKKAQEEIVGFVLVVVVIMIMLFIFIGFMSLKNDNSSRSDSPIIEDFLSGLMISTTNCTIQGDIQPLSVEELFTSCEFKETCEDGIKSCNSLEFEITNSLDLAFKTNNYSKIKGYEFGVSSNSTFFENNTIKKGDCSGDFQGAERRILINKDGVRESLAIYLNVCTS